MSEQKLIEPQETPGAQDQETPEDKDLKRKNEFIDQIRALDPKEIVPILEVFSMMVRAFEGRDVAPDSDQITRLINIKNILERSNFPTMAIINFQVYARMLAHYYPGELDAFRIWADFQAQALKSLKALSSEQYVDMFKAAQGGQPAAAANISLAGVPQEPQKRGVLSRIRRQREPPYSEKSRA